MVHVGVKCLTRVAGVTKAARCQKQRERIDELGVVECFISIRYWFSAVVLSPFYFLLPEGKETSYPGVVKTGAYLYPDGTKYYGDWNAKGEKHGMGRVKLLDKTFYHGTFLNNLSSGLGVMTFSDGAKYEGELMQGWFHGYGVFWRADGTKYEGEFRGGRIWGLGLMTFADGTHGFPRNEGYFRDCRLLKRKSCLDVVQRAQKAALMARVQGEDDYDEDKY